MMMMDAMLSTAKLDVAPLHKNGHDGGDTIFVLRAHLDAEHTILLGRVYMPYEQDVFNAEIEPLLPEEVRQAGFQERGHRIEDDFPDDPAHPKNRGRDVTSEPAALDEAVDVEWLKQLFERDA
jgi:hypothetical protein